MKTIQSVLFLSAALLLLAAPAPVKAQFTFTTNNGAITITGYTGPGGAVTIPSAINGWPVTSIGDNAFNNCTNLTTATIPNSVTNIGDYAFNFCASLTSVTISTNVTSIGQGTFSACTRLASVTIPANVTSIGETAFEDCGSLADINIPDSVTNIGDFAFTECDSLASVTIPNSVSSLGAYAFAYCDTLTNIMIGANATSLGAYAFGGCPSLTAISVASNNPAYSGVAGVLFNQNQTTLLLYPRSHPGSSYTIPDGVTSIGDYAFESCGNLTSITIPASVASIGDYAFAYSFIVFNFTTPEIVVFFQGNAPSADSTVFNGQYDLTVYYLPGTTGWGSTFAGVPTTPWNPSVGLLQATILPNFPVSVGAQWQVDNGTWQSSGTTLTNLALGNHAVSFSTIAGWTTPASQTVFVTSNAIATAIGTYVPLLFDYITNNGTITITRYNGPGGSVSIPGTLGGLPVTSIGDNAFAWCATLTNVIFPDSVTNLSDGAFQNCSSLTSVTIGTNVTGIGDGAFQQCASMTAITVVAGNPMYSSVAGVLFNRDQTRLIQYPEGKTDGSYTIPNRVTYIGDNAFYFCASLTNVTIPNSVTGIGGSAFTGSGLTRVAIPQNVTSIGFAAFQNCTNLTAITVAANNSDFGSVAGVLFSQDQTTLIQYPEGKTGGRYTIPQGVTSLGYAAFQQCTSLTSVTIPDSVTSIEDNAFYGCTHLTSVSLPNSVTDIGDDAFDGCSSLTSVTIPDGLTSLGFGTFQNCTSLTNVTIPANVTAIADFAFAWCPSLTGVYFLGNAPTNVDTGVYFLDETPALDSDVFYADNQVTLYYLPDTSGWSSTVAGVPTATWNPPLGSLQVTILPATVIAAGAQWQVDGGAWQGSGATVSNLLVGGHTVGFSAATGWGPPASQTVFVNSNEAATATGTYVPTSFTYTINGGTITITGYTGSGGTVFIPGAINGLPVTSLGEGAFQNCASLTSVSMPNSVVTIGDNAFQFCNHLTNLTIGASVTSLGAWAFAFCDSLTSITIPNRVNSIGEAAFSGCASLRAITVAASNPAYRSVAGVLFNRNQTALIEYPDGKAGGSYTIPDSVTSLGQAAFENCGNLTRVTVPNQVMSIGDFAFASCNNLTNVTIGTNVTSLGLGAFQSCGSLTCITIPNSVTSIGDWAFQNCASLTCVTLGTNVTSLGDGVFAGCNYLTVVFFQGNAPSAGWEPFNGDNNLAAYYLPDTTGWSSTFAGVSTTPWNPSAGLLQVAILPAAASGAGAQWQVDDGTWQSSGTMMNNLSLGDHTVSFSTVSGWTTPATQTVFVSSNAIATVIGTYAPIPFAYATTNGTITITGYNGPGGSATIPATINGLPVTGIGSGSPGFPYGYVFFGSGVTNLTIPNSVTNIAVGAFQYCPNLTAITVAPGNPAYSSVAGVLFNQGLTSLIQYPADKAGSSYTIPGGVTNVGDFAFYGCSNLTSTTIPNGVIRIGNYAFENTRLSNVTIGSGVVSLGELAFFDCARLTSVTIPNSVTNIGFEAFQNCSSLTAFNVDTLNPAYSSKAGVWFNKSQTLLRLYPERKAGAYYSVPQSVTSIGDLAFQSCTGLASVTIPESVTNIGDEAFQSCTHLASAMIGSRVVSIGNFAFESTRLNQVTIPDSVVNIGASAFAYCPNLNAITIGSGVTNLGTFLPGSESPEELALEIEASRLLALQPVQPPGTGPYAPYDAIGLEESAFYDCTNLAAITVNPLNPAYSSVAGVLFNKRQTLLIQYPDRKAGAAYTIPGGVTNIGNSAFQFCATLTSVIIPDSVSILGETAFQACANLASVRIGNRVTNIGNAAFANCGRLAGANIPDSVNGLGEDAFFGCSNLAIVTIGNNVTNLGNAVFAGCIRLTSVNIPNSVNSIGNDTFFGCSNLTSVTLGDNVTSIGENAFVYCTSLTNVMIPNSVTKLEADAFYGCANLTSVTIGNGVAYIGDSAFASCTRLEGVFFQGNAPGVDTNWFAGAVFSGDNQAAAYYLTGTTGWGTTFGGIPTVLWTPHVLSEASFDVAANRFGFKLAGFSNQVIVVEACTNLSRPLWQPVQTNTLTGGPLYFTDPQSTNYPARFYRVRDGQAP